ncbi:MAG TPA: sulfatase [Verrucomicrobiae bacterium]|nr:sulfatase [Verrucomicrobiae bacterium]
MKTLLDFLSNRKYLQPARPRAALSLLGVFLVARTMILIGRDVPFSPWSPVAYLWQDLLVVALFAIVTHTAKRGWILWTGYGAMVAYVALNVPVTRLLSSPMTLPMFRATRGTLADSIEHHLTIENLALIGALLAVAAVLPFSLRRYVLSKRIALTLGAASVVILALGPYASRRVDTAGLHRNVFAALVSTALPRVEAIALERDWRQSPFGSNSGEDLSRFRDAAKGRNVIMIALESTGAQYLKPYSAVEDPMPNLTGLAEQAILFENAYAVYPESIKGLFSVLCSRYPAIDTKAELCARVATPSIAQRLGSAGYRTALFHSGRFLYLGMDAIVENRGFDVLEDAGDIGGNRNSSFGVDDEATVERMLGWIDSLARGDRFFITYLPVAGHHPYDTPAPGPFAGDSEVGRYRNALHYSDAVLGKLLEGLKQRGRFDDTLFIIFGDHSEAFGQHEGNYGHTLFVCEENVRVPYLIVAPGLIDGRIRVRRIASLIDTAPTILDLVGLPSPTSYQGTSLLGKSDQMALFFTDYSLGLLGLRDGPWKFVHELESGRNRLFDLTADAREEKDVATRHPERVRTYRDHLLAWSGAQRALLIDAKPAPARLASRLATP